MKKLLMLAGVLLLATWGNAHATFVSGSTGSDGSFDLSVDPPAVPTGTIINGNTATVPLPVDGIFNFTTVNVPSGKTVTFTKNAANTPVYVLATGDVTIAGTIDVSGGSAGDSTVPGKGGPGGYDGGNGGATNVPGGWGLGPGGGISDTTKCDGSGFPGGNGSFGTTGGMYCGTSAPGSVYGDARLIPLIGGSGGAGSVRNNQGYGGGGGGGAILVASSESITVTGSIISNGGNGNNISGGGSGGAIKLMANSISGYGIIHAEGGIWQDSRFQGGLGRIRLESYSNSFPGTDPPYTYGQPRNVFEVNAPVLAITSIGGVNTPSYPTGSYTQPDVMLPDTTTNPVTVTLAANNIPVGTTVTVSVIPQYGSATEVTTTLSGTDSSSTGSANVDLSTQYSNVITAQATFTMQQAMYYNGEKIKKVKVAATMGGRSNAVYITESGKEIKAKELAMTGYLK